MKKLALIALFATGTLSFLSCSSDDDNGRGNSPEQTLVPVKFVYTGSENGFEEYEYNTNRYLTKITSTLNASISQYQFSYISNKLSKVIEDNPGTDEDYEYIISYEGSDNIKIEQKKNNASVKIDYIKVNADGTLRSYDTTSFSYSDGNLVQKFEAGNATNYEYLAEESLYKNIKTESWVFSYFKISPEAKNKNQLKSIKHANMSPTTLSYSDYQVGNLFPKKISTVGPEDNFTQTVTYQ
ncbi:hypothetical protein ACF3NR_08430 [Vaginella massiliensis]|uniref:hypothetical protein n=1 Tax=Vaginella massiliensis TaxID=1816680 RepID=UPI00375197E1